MVRPRIWMAIVLALLPALGSAEIYRCTAKDGLVTFTDTPCGDAAGTQAVRAPTIPPSDVDPRRISPPAVLGGAADPFDGYVADLDRLNSDQSRNPGHIIRYSDRTYGQLLESVLAPNRARAMLAIFFQRSVQGQHPPNIAISLGTLLRSVGAAFQKHPKAYEREYLDAFEDEEAAAEMSIPAISASIAALSTQKAQEGMQKLRQRGVDFGDLKKMLRSSYRLIGLVSAAEARTLQKQIAGHMFSDAGAQRAQAIANRLTRIAAQYLPAEAIKVG